MTLRHSLLATGASVMLIGSGADAAPAAKHPRRTPSATAQLLEEVKALRAQVDELRAKVDSQASLQAAQQSQTDARLQSAQSTAETVQVQVAAAPTAIKSEVGTQVAAAIVKEHHNDKFYLKGVTLTPGGFVELSGIYRDHFMGNDIATAFNAIPFPNNRPGQVAEGRFSARQSRVSLLAEGVVNPKVKLSMYGEFDFQGAAQTANSNESNSYNPRVRNLYGTIDWTGASSGFHLLAGQNWSLVTMNSKGITPRNELTPPQIDAQYVPGFAWTRQPGIRLTGDFLDHRLWIAVSAENPQTTFGGTVPANVTNNAPAGAGFDAMNTLSLNHVPDFIGKVAYEVDLGGHGVHLEGFGLYRSFSEHLASGDNGSAHGVSYGGGITVQVVPKLLDVQVSGMTGKGIGRYGSSQLPDVTFAADGQIVPLKETMLLAGATIHATKLLDIYGFAGEERVDRSDQGTVGTTLYGYGNALANNSGCLIEGGTCAGNSHVVRQYTAGVWQKIYQGAFGRAQVGFQYSHTERELFAAVGGAPEAKQDIGFLSFRYYPF